MQNSNSEYFNQRVKIELGLTGEELRIPLMDLSGKLVNKPIIYPDEDDNICIRVFNIDRELIQIDHPKATPEKPSIFNDRKQDYIVKRLKKPIELPDGEELRYLMPKDRGTFPLPSPKLLDKYEKQNKVETLVLTEGFLKMFALVKQDVDVIGLSSITHYRDKVTNGLHQDIVKVINRCKVNNVIMLYDGDCFDLSEKALEQGKDLQKRPLAFYSSAKKIHQLLKELNVTFYFGFINSKNIQGSPKGIDDLFIQHPGKEMEVIEELLGSSTTGKYISKFAVDHASNDLVDAFPIWTVQKFYEKYKQSIGTREFVYRDKHYRYDAESPDVVRIIKLNGSIVQFDKKLQFWDYRLDKDGNETNVAYFDYAKSYDFLEANGFFKMEKCDGSFVYVHLVGNVLKEVSSQHIRDFMINFLKEYGDDNVLNMIFRGSNRYIGATSLSNLPTKKPKIIENSATNQYLFFKKHYWHITNTGIKTKTYDSLKGIIWSDQIIDRDIKLLPELIQFANSKTMSSEYFFEEIAELVAKEFPYSHFYQFLADTSKMFWEKEQNGTITEAENREQNVHLINKLSALGYLLHKFRDNSKTYAVIGVDNKISEVGESNGGTGKSLFGIAVEQVAKTVYIPGKSTKLTDNNHIWQNVDENTNIIFFDDVRMAFDFEFLYPIITGKMLVNPKGKPAFYIPESNTPKIFITSNHAVRCQNNSDERRQFKIAFSDYYNKDTTPFNKFGCNLFSKNWPEEQWALFYNLVALSTQIYLAHGKIEAPGLNIEKRQLRQDMGENFLAWADEYYSLPENLNTDQDKKDLFTEYQNSDYANKKYVTIVQFKKKVKAYAKYKGYQFNKEKGGNDMKRNGREYFNLATE